MSKQAKTASLGIKVRFEGPQLKVTGRVKKGDNSQENDALLTLQDIFADFLQTLFNKAGANDESAGDSVGLRDKSEGSPVS